MTTSLLNFWGGSACYSDSYENNDNNPQTYNMSEFIMLMIGFINVGNAMGYELITELCHTIGNEL